MDFEHQPEERSDRQGLLNLKTTSTTPPAHHNTPAAAASQQEPAHHSTPRRTSQYERPLYSSVSHRRLAIGLCCSGAVGLADPARAPRLGHFLATAARGRRNGVPLEAPAAEHKLLARGA